MLEMYAGSRVTPPIVDGADLAVFCGYITLDFVCISVSRPGDNPLKSGVFLLFNLGRYLRSRFFKSTNGH